MGVTPLVRQDAAGLPTSPASNAALQAGGRRAQRQGFVIAQLDKLFNWARTGSLWPMTFGLACCAVEMMHAYMARTTSTASASSRAAARASPT